MPKLPGNNSDVDPSIGEVACPGVPESVYVDPLLYCPFYTVTGGKFTNVRGVDAASLVTGKEDSMVVMGPYGHPRIELPRRLRVDSDHPSLTALALEYSDGSVFRVDIAHSERKNFPAPELRPESQQEDALIAAARDGVCESPEEPLGFF